MSERKLDAELSREAVLARVVSAERESRELLQQAARITTDPEERELYERLLARETESLRQLVQEEERLEAEAFVQKALDV